MIVDPVLRIRRPTPGAEQPLVIRLVVAEEKLGCLAAGPVVRDDLERAEEGMLRLDLRHVRSGAQHGGIGVDLPRPRVAVPRRRQHVERVGLGAGVGDLHGEEDVEGIALRVVRLDDPVAIVVEDARVQQLELGIELRAGGVLVDESRVGELRLRIVVAPPVPRMARRRVEVPPVLLGVLAVVALVAREAEDPLLQDRVAAVPEREAEAEALLDVAEPGEPVLSPSVCARAGIVVREVLPRRPVRAVVLAHGAPLPFAHVRAPEVPVARLAQPVLELPESLDPRALRARYRRSGVAA